MKKYFLFMLVYFCAYNAIANGLGNGGDKDTIDVIQLNKRGYSMRLTSPDQTFENATKALAIAQRLNYTAGIAESYRILGIGNYYLNRPVKAIDDYLTSLTYFTQLKDLRSQARVYNNIGNLYRDNDYDRALDFFQKGLVIAKKLNDTHLIASLYLNIGDVYYRKKSYYRALSYDNQSTALFTTLRDSTNLILCLQNKGVIYFYLHQFDIAEDLLIKANKGAKQLDLNEPVASIDLTLTSIYIAQDKYDDADRTIEEGLAFAEIINDEKLLSDFKYTSYKLELKRKDYQKAVLYLQDIYKQDSIVNKTNSSTQITLIQEQVKQQARQRQNEVLLQRQENDRIKFWSLVIVASLLLILVGLLISNVKRKAKTNTQLTDLNAEVSRQKDNLDRINHHLEEIIDERTKDLQEKNKKLSEYSSYLSHQIRGPIATLKGLMNLEKEGLIDHTDCILMMNKCVSEIDDKIIEMSDMLHDPEKAGF